MKYIKNIKNKNVDISQWKEYSLETLFFSDVGDFDIQKKHIEKTGDIVISSGVTNNGIIGKTNIKAKVFDENTITVDMFGNSYYRNYKYKMVTHGRVFSLKSHEEKNTKAILFVATILNKYLPLKYNYNNMCSWNKIAKDKILLPSIFNKEKNHYEPDWDYMDTFIDELYTKLNIESISKTLNTLKNIGTEKINLISWKTYKIGDLFEIKGSKTTAKNILEKIGVGEYPYITTTAENQGISGYYNHFTEDGNVLTFDSAVLGTCFYQEKNFSASDHVELGIPKYHFNKKIGLFLQTVINKTNEGVYHYGHKANQKRIRETIIKLPSIFNDETHKYEPDWNYMENYIDILEQKIFN